MFAEKAHSLEAQQRELETKLRNSDGNAEALKTQLDNVNSQLKNVNASFYKVKSDLDNLSNSISTKSITVLFICYIRVFIILVFGESGAFLYICVNGIA